MTETPTIKRVWDETVKTFFMEGLTTPDGKREITQAIQTTDNATGTVSWGWKGYELTTGKRRSNSGLTAANFYFDEEIETALIAEIVVAMVNAK